MKTSFKRLVSILMAVMLLFALASAAFAAKSKKSDPGVSVSFPPGSDLTLKVGEKTKVSATVKNADKGAEYFWYCSDESVVSIKPGKAETVTITAVGVGEAQIILSVANGDGESSASDFFSVSVKSAHKPVSVSGGGEIKMNAGDTKTLSGKVSGGSGSYTYEWEAYGDAAISFVDKMRNQAEIYAGKSGSGTVFLTVYDAEDPTNNSTAMWDVTVTSKKQAKPPEIQLNHGSIDLGVGGSGSLKLSVKGGSGNYEYFWNSDNPRVVSIDAHGELADLYAAKTLIPGSNTAEISVYVRDVNTGLASDTARCVVRVSGGSTTYDAYANVKVGDQYGMDELAKEMSLISQVDLGKKIDLSATIKFSSTSSKVGSLRLQDGTSVRSGSNYTFASFQDMVFHASAAGSFVVDYYITDGGNTISGAISIGVEGRGRGVESIALSPKTLKMPTYSNEYLTLSVSPSNAYYDVSWEVASPTIVSIVGAGSKVTLKSSGYVGSTQVIATVTDVNGNETSAVCNVTVYDDSSTTFDTSLTLMLGSDYYGSKLADSMSAKFKSEFSVYPGDNAEIYFTSLGNSTYGEMHLLDGSPVYAKRTYTFRQWIEMYFTPYAKGTYSFGYELTYRGNTLKGNIKVIIEAASMSVTINPTSLRMAPFSSQYINLDISPASARYRVSWISSNPTVATVSGSNATAVVNSLAAGTTTITAVVTDANGFEIRRGCTVIVDSSDTVFNPSVSTTIGIPYVGTGTSSAMRSQFASLYNITLEDSAIIRFSSSGNTDVGVMRLADGSPIKPNTDYTLAQYVGMYTEPISAGTFSVPYALSFAGKSLSGTVSVVISPASIVTNFALPSNAPYSFSDSMNDSTGAAVFSGSISNAVGSNWGYITFESVSSGAGTLYLDRSSTAIKSGTTLTAAALADLYFVPGELNGTFTAPFVVYTAAGKVLGTGTLNIARPGKSFTDVPTDAYYAKAVDWAVDRGITSGTGGSNFSPDMYVTRGQAVTFLWRAAGQPKAFASVNPFTDVAAGAYYYEAVLWAVQQGITNGTSDTTFSPDNQLNRDQLLTFLCRANGGYAGGADWSQLAADWANARGLLAGIPGAFVANSACPRCDVVYYLWKNYNT